MPYDKKEPKRIGSILNRIIDTLGLEEQYERSQIEKIWNEMQEPNLSKAASVVSFSDGILTVKARSHVWKSELFLRRENITDLINKKYGSNIIKDIKVE